MLVLGIESSCDETAAAVVDENKNLLSSVVFSQPEHVSFGGVVPEIAARAHLEKITSIVTDALSKANIGFSDLDAVAASAGPGLIGGVIVGVMTAKAIAAVHNIPFIAVNHLEAHALTARLGQDVPFPYLLLLTSGGHCQILVAEGVGKFKRLGATIDDAAGEAFDKAARVLSIPYPGGPLLDKLAWEGNPNALALPKPRLEGRYDFSFSGLKTALINRVHQLHQAGQDVPAADIAASFRKAVVDQLVGKALLAAREHGAKALAVAGGVAANSLLRQELTEGAQKLRIPCYMPPLSLCTDNAAMIGSAAFWQLLRGELAALDLNAEPGLELPV